jgi:hypothetical protein
MVFRLSLVRGTERENIPEDTQRERIKMAIGLPFYAFGEYVSELAGNYAFII